MYSSLMSIIIKADLSFSLIFFYWNFFYINAYLFFHRNRSLWTKKLRQCCHIHCFDISKITELVIVELSCSDSSDSFQTKKRKQFFFDTLLNTHSELRSEERRVGKE